MTSSGLGLSDAIVREIQRFDPNIPIERAWSPPKSWYTEQAFLDLERDAVFSRTWQPIARADQLSEPGRFVTGCVLGMPWCATRDLNGELRAFHNVCLHRGREVVIGTGKADKLVCGYHGWTYDVDGRLRKAPRMAGVEDFDREVMSLKPMRIEQWGPWIFVNGDMDAQPLAERLAPLGALLDRGGWEKLKYVQPREWVIECNWKVYCDNYLDGGYHIPHMHPSLDAQLDMDSYRTELFDEFNIQTSSPAKEQTRGTAVDVEARIGQGAIYAWIYPNLMINRYGPCLDSNYVVPLGPNRCKVVYEFYFLEPEVPGASAFIAGSVAQSDITQKEDIEICESVQVGLRSPAYDRGRYAPRVETGEHHFHRLLAGSLRRAAGVRD